MLVWVIGVEFCVGFVVVVGDWFVVVVIWYGGDYWVCFVVYWCVGGIVG